MREIPCWLAWKSLVTGLAWRKARDLDHFRMVDIGGFVYGLREQLVDVARAVLLCS